MERTVVSSLPTYAPMGEQAVIIQYEKVISLAVSRRVQSCAYLIEENNFPGILQIIPSFNSITIYYDPIIIEYHQLIRNLQCLGNRNSSPSLIKGKTIYFPAVFGGKYGSDLEEVSDKTGFSPQEVVDSLHSKPYFVYMTGGFAGFPYCGDIDERLSLPRRSNPRLRVEKGAILMVNKQTGIYPIAAPTGWYMVGWTPMEIFNPYREMPGLLRAGDSIQYIPISPDRAEIWDGKRQREWDEEWNQLKL